MTADVDCGREAVEALPDYKAMWRQAIANYQEALARAEAAEGERNSILQEAMEETVSLKAQRDAAIARAEGMRAALEEAKETILYLVRARGSEAEGREEDYVAGIDAVLAAPAQEDKA